MSKFTIDRPVVGGNIAPSAAKGGTAAEFTALIDAILADPRVASVEFDVDDGVIYDAGVRFVNQGAGVASFVYPSNATSVAFAGRHTRFDLFKLNPGFTGLFSKSPTVIRRKRDGSKFHEFVPGSRTFMSAHGWNLRKIHNALRALDLKAEGFSKVLERNFGQCAHPVIATREGFRVGA